MFMSVRARACVDWEHYMDYYTRVVSNSHSNDGLFSSLTWSHYSFQDEMCILIPPNVARNKVDYKVDN